MPLSSAAGKKSLFARELAAQRLKEGRTPLHCAPAAAHTPERREQNRPPDTCMETDQCGAAEPTAFTGPSLLSGRGLGGPDSSAESMRIHRENQAKLQDMSQSEILLEQKKLLSQLGRQLCHISYILI